MRTARTPSATTNDPVSSAQIRTSVGQEVVAGKCLAGGDVDDRGAEAAGSGGRELGEEVGEGLAHAAGVSQAHAGDGQTQRSEAHSDAVVVVGVDFGASKL